jgi:hypothetical protein
MLELLPSDPLFYAAAVASFIGIACYFYYSTFILQNYSKIKWLRRMLFPHISYFLKKVDKQTPNTNISKLYVETPATHAEKICTIHLAEEEDEDEVVSDIGEVLLKNHFRPEVILASLSKTSDGDYEVGNWVLTAPTKNHSDMWGTKVLHDLFIMLTARRQLHVRIFYDDEEHAIEFYAHEEYNPYNPLFSRKHFYGEGFDVALGQELFKQEVLPELEKEGLIYD